MKRLLVALIVTTLVAPALAAADATSDIEMQVMFLLGRAAAIEAMSSGAPVACGLVTSKAVVRVGEPYELIWNTYGAQDLSDTGSSRFAPRGILTVAMQQAGTFKYKITFDGAAGGQATCSAQVIILP